MNFTLNVGNAKLPFLVAGMALSVSAWAAPQENVRDGKEPVPDATGVIPQKIIHRTVPPQVSTISPFGKAPSEPAKAAQLPAGSTKSNTSPIKYHGGPVMASITQIVLIWYGDWTGALGNNTDTPQGQQIIRNAIYGMANDEGSSVYTNYSGITTNHLTAANFGYYTQYGSAGPVGQISSSAMTECTQPTSAVYGGTTLSDASVLALVQAAAQTCSGGPDSSTIYLVLSSSNIGESSGFLTKYCGWHTYSTMSAGSVSVPVKYGFIGNPSASIGSCTYQTSVSPNGNPGVDAMVSVIAHELEETVTDPQLNAWYNAKGSEDGDMCAWTFGSEQKTASNGSYYNVVLPLPATFVYPYPAPGTYNNQYMIQRALAVRNSACYINSNPVLQ